MERARLIKSAILLGLLPGIAATCVVGCAERGAMAIPPSATVLSSGQNGLVTATPSVAGTIYVYDSTANRLIYSGAVQPQDKVVVDPGASLVTINGATVSEPHLFNDHQYMIEFDHP